MRVLWLLPILALTAAAQPPAPEIRGIVAELGTRAPLAGAIATLYEFAPNEDNLLVRKAIATAATGPDGVFSFKPGHLGRFQVGVAKDGYSSGGNPSDAPLAVAELDQKTPIQSIRLSLTRPGTLTGRVIDRDGNPVANLRIGLDQIHSPDETFYPGAISSTVTNADGAFNQPNLSPGNYIIHIEPQRRDEKAAGEGEELAAFTDADFKKIDEDVEPSYWPGNLPSPDGVLPITVSGGGVANAGTITIRKVPYYRVRLLYKGECAPNERWTFRVRPANNPRNIANTEQLASCHNDGLITRLAPGSYELDIWSGRDVDRWAIVPFTIKDQNVEVPLTFNDPAVITGRVTTPPGGPDLKTLGAVQILLRSSQGLPSSKPLAEPKDGLFTFDAVQWTSQWISVRTLGANTYVKEIRYNGLPLRRPEMEASSGSTLDIVLDEGAATLNVILKTGDAPAYGLAMLAPASVTNLTPIRGAFEPFIFMNSSRGPIIFKNLPPGDYHLYAAPISLSDQFLRSDGSDLATRFSQAPTITLNRGEQKSIELQVKP